MTSKARLDLMVGKDYISNEGLKFKIISMDHIKNGTKYFNCTFEETNKEVYECVVCFPNILAGKIKNPYYNSVAGTARLGMKNANKHKIELSKWVSMIHRCYNCKDSRYKYYGGAGVKVCDEWLIFKNFLNDFRYIKGYDLEKIKSLHLDKDIIGNSKLYNLKNCCFVTLSENNKEMNRRTKQKFFIATRLVDNYKEEHYNQLEFSKKYDLNSRHISDILKGNRKTHKGWTFKYL